MSKSFMTKNGLTAKEAETHSFFGKWLFLMVVITVYLFLSLCIIRAMIPDPVNIRECGTGLFALIIVHFFLAAIVLLIVGIKFYLNRKYSITTMFVVLLLILMPPVISYFLF